MTKWIVIVAALVGCGGKKDDSSGGGAPKTADESALPGEVTAWAPKAAADLWQGAWSSRLTLRTSGTMSMAGDPAAIEIKGDKATVFDGKADQQLGFVIETPCSVSFKLNKGGATYSFDKQFIVRDGKLVVGEGAVGYRKGKTAIACISGLDHLVTADDKGCKVWSNKFGKKWESSAKECTWGTDGGKDTLTIGKGDFGTKLTADGDFLVTDQFNDSAKLTTKAASFDEAKKSLPEAK